MEADIKTEFVRSGFRIEQEEQVLKKCLTFCINYSLKPSELISCWELYFLNRQIAEAIVKDDEMDGFLLFIQNEKKEEILKDESHLHVYSSHDVDTLMRDEDENMEEAVLPTRNQSPSVSTPHTNDLEDSSTKSSKSDTPFAQRKNRFTVQASLNESLSGEKVITRVEGNDEDILIKRIGPKENCVIQHHGSYPENGCRFMYDRIEDRFLFIEERITKHARALVSSGMHEEPVDPTEVSRKSLFAVGMIYSDGQERLNEKAVFLQTSCKHSGGQRVSLDLQKLSQFSIFPGQVVGVEGYNPSGHCLIASKLFNSIPLPSPFFESSPPAKKRALDQQPQSVLKQKELSMIVAAGPFTTTENLSFEPLTELLGYVSRKLPQLLLLLGPFVDSEHPEISKGTVDQTFSEIFHAQILNKLKDFVEFIGSTVRVILVPSVRDAHHDFVFPQPRFDIDIIGRISSAPNPVILSADDVRIGCCTVDILKQLSREEISRQRTGGGGGDRRSRLLKHILDQRCFYPLYPQSEDVPMDFSMSSGALDIPLIPHVLFLPSDLTSYIKVLSSSGEGGISRCMCVNPGRLAKGVGGGSFVEVHFQGDVDTSYASIINI